MNQKVNHILIPIDGSEQAVNAVHYTATLFPQATTRITLLHVDTPIPEPFLDLGNREDFHSKAREARDWAVKKRNQYIESVFGTATSILRDHGFGEDRVETRRRMKQKGTARDIIQETKAGYDAVVIGRNGLSRIKDLIVGSVATKLMDKVDQIPVIVVGKIPVQDEAALKNILVAFDGSEGAMHSIEVLAKLLPPSEGGDCTVTLCHVIRALNFFQGQESISHPEYESEWASISKKEIAPRLTEAENRLKALGFAGDRIGHRILTGKLNRGGAVVADAGEHGCATVVVGGKGHSKVEDFLMGRVSRQIFQMAERMAVWVAH